MNKEMSIHIPGCGDMKIKDVSYLPDPCPLPEQIKKRALVEKERLIYAPFSGVGGIVYDKDAVYVELGGSHSYKQEDTGLASALMDTQETLDKKLQRSELQLFSDAAPIKSQDVNETMAPYTGELVTENGRVRRKVIFNDEELENGSDEDADQEDENEDNDDDDNDDNDDNDDDDTEDESSDEETVELNKMSAKRKRSGEDDTQSKKKKTPVDAGDEDDNMNLDKIELIKDKKKVLQENTGIYHSLSKESDILIKNKVSEALSFLESTGKNAKQNFDEESFDEFSDGDSRAGLEMDDLDLAGDLEEREEEEEEEEIKEGDKDDEVDENKEVADELKWKTNLAEKAKQAFINRQQNNKNLMKLVYDVFDTNNLSGQIKDEEDEEDEVGVILRTVRKEQKQKIQERELQNQDESVFFTMESPRDWLENVNKALLVNRFVTGKWKESEDAEELLKLDDMDDNEEEEIYGDFEDLETGQKHEGTQKVSKESPADEMDEKKKLLEKKRKLKEQFDADYDNSETKTFYDQLKAEVDRQAGINKSEFEGIDDDLRVQLEGYRPGMYVRVEIEMVPCELIMHLDPTYPIIIGGLLHGEENIGYVQARIKKHRWYSRILKSRDPLIFSIGWRRFQSLPIYSKLEDNLRHRMLKYTPEHVACMSYLWGPITPQGTGILAVKDVVNREPGFRIAMTGSIVEITKSVQVVKKLKLTGVPLKIYRKTAFIKDMFNSALEVAKFEGAKIKTVSGIRGQIKRAAAKPEGCFRATFEDKIQLSDIVFCRTWYKVEVPKFYNPVMSLLLPLAEKNQWRGMKTTGQLKRERNIHAEANRDSMYTSIQREVKVFRPIFVPRKLQKQLPYKDKPKPKPLPNRNPKFGPGRVTVVREPSEQKVARLMRMIRMNYGSKQKQIKEATTKRITDYQARLAAEEAKKMKKQREVKKEIFRNLSKSEKKKKR